MGWLLDELESWLRNVIPTCSSSMRCELYGSAASGIGDDASDIDVAANGVCSEDLHALHEALARPEAAMQRVRELLGEVVMAERGRLFKTQLCSFFCKGQVHAWE